jgi:hypothetical protein
MPAYAFVFEAWLRPVVALVGAHGATDLDTRTWPIAYLTAALLPARTVMPVFMFFSLLHFSEDVGFVGSISLHVIAGLVWQFVSAQKGLELMLAYLAGVHTPLHYHRCWMRGRCGGLGMAFLATLGAWNLLGRTRTVTVSEAAQRVVIAHVLTEGMIWGSSGV